ncbi:MAG: hypothetical protein IJC46_03285 [Clostridia bacterium]|nr:hypothetical protein [Clostridia bacterium]
MTLWITLSILWTVLTAAAYRLGMADGLSAARRGRLAGGKEPKSEALLNRIEAYDGRKESYAKHK